MDVYFGKQQYYEIVQRFNVKLVNELNTSQASNYYLEYKYNNVQETEDYLAMHDDFLTDDNMGIDSYEEVKEHFDFLLDKFGLSVMDLYPINSEILESVGSSIRNNYSSVRFTIESEKEDQILMILLSQRVNTVSYKEIKTVEILICKDQDYSLYCEEIESIFEGSEYNEGYLLIYDYACSGNLGTSDYINLCYEIKIRI